MIKNKYLLPTIFVTLQIIFMVDTSLVYFHWGSKIAILGTLVLGILFIFKDIFILKKTKTIRGVWFLLIILSINFLSSLVNNSSGKESIFLAIVIFSAFLCINIFTFEEYIQGYIYALLLFAIISLIGLYIIMPMIITRGLDFFPTVYNRFNVPMVDMGLFYAIKRTGIQRNYGIFREPGVYQFFLLIGITAELFYIKREKKIKKYIVGFFIIVMFTTISTVGIITLVLIIIAYFLNKDDKKILLRILWICLAIFGAYLFIKNMFPNYYLYLQNNTFLKLFNNNDNISFAVRSQSIINLIKVSFMRPFFGWHVEDGYNYIINNLINYNTNDITGTFFIICMALGLPIGITCMLWFYNFCSYLNTNSRNRLVNFIIFIALFLSVNSQNLLMNTILWTINFTKFSKKL